MKIIFHLSTCSTCQRILKELDLPDDVMLQDIKTTPITSEQIDHMKSLAGSFEALFSKRALKYRSLGLHEMELNEQEMRGWILKEYTFLKRPVAILGSDIFIGSAKTTVKELKLALA